MRRGALIIEAFTILLAINSIAYAGCFLTGSDLVENIEQYEKFELWQKGLLSKNMSNDETLEITVMAAGLVYYLEGVVDCYNEILFYVPEGVNPKQITAITIKYIKSHPEEWNECAHFLVVKAIAEAFPKKSE